MRQQSAQLLPAFSASYASVCARKQESKILSYPALNCILQGKRKNSGNRLCWHAAGKRISCAARGRALKWRAGSGYCCCRCLRKGDTRCKQPDSGRKKTQSPTGNAHELPPLAWGTANCPLRFRLVLRLDTLHRPPEKISQGARLLFDRRYLMRVLRISGASF